MIRNFPKSDFSTPYLAKTTGLILLLASIFVFCVSCSDDDDPTTAVLPVFSVTPVDISYNPADASYGNIIFEDPVLTPFGASIGNDQFLPGMEYFTIPGAPVRAVTAGIVDAIIENPIEGDYQIRVVATPGSDYMIIYDHVNEVNVLQISQVMPGDTLGEAGNWNDTIRRFILSISLGEGANERFYCPINYGDSAFVAQHNELLQAYNTWSPDGDYDSFCLREFVIHQ